MRDDAAEGDADRAEHVEDADEGVADIDHGAADRGERLHDADAVPSRRRRQLDLVQFVDQRAVILLQADDLGRGAAAFEGAHEPLQEPRPERVEPLDLPHVDRHLLDRRMPLRRGVDLALERLRIGRGPCAGGREPQGVALRGVDQQCVRHRGLWLKARESQQGLVYGDTRFAFPDAAKVTRQTAGRRRVAGASEPSWTPPTASPFVSPSRAGRSRVPSRSAAARRPRPWWWSPNWARARHAAAANACPTPDTAKPWRPSLPPSRPCGHGSRPD